MKKFAVNEQFFFIFPRFFGDGRTRTLRCARRASVASIGPDDPLSCYRLLRMADAQPALPDAALPALPYAALPVASIDPYEVECTNARKLVLRALDTKIAQQDDAAALGAIRLALKLATNVIEHPDEPKYSRVKATSQALQRNLTRVPGGQELLVAMGFRTTVHLFEEHWSVEVTPLSLRVLEVAAAGLAHYETSVAARAEQKTKARANKLTGTNAHKEQIMAEIEVRQQSLRAPFNPRDRSLN